MFLIMQWNNNNSIKGRTRLHLNTSGHTAGGVCNEITASIGNGWVHMS